MSLSNTISLQKVLGVVSESLESGVIYFGEPVRLPKEQ